MVKKLFLVSGATGFVGSHVKYELAVVRKKTVITVDRNLHFFLHNQGENPRQIENCEAIKFFENGDVTFIHCATKFLKFNNPNDVSLLLQANVDFPLKILEFLRGISNLLVINLNSYWQAVDGKVGFSNSTYADTKNEFITRLKGTPEYDSFSHKDIYLFDTYGPQDKRDKLFPYLFERFQHFDSLELNDVGQLMNFLHVNDVVSGILRVCEDSSSTNVFELSSNYNFTLPLILEKFEKVFSKKIPCRWYSKEPLCYMKEKWNIAPTPTGWKETISLELGLSHMKKEIV